MGDTGGRRIDDTALVRCAHGIRGGSALAPPMPVDPSITELILDQACAALAASTAA